MSAYGVSGERVELKDTAFFPGEDRYAAPVALATLLYTDGAKTGPDTVAPRLNGGADAAALEPMLVSAALGFERLPYVLAPRLQDVVAELRDNRPVMVLLNTGTATTAAWRYAVVIGIEPGADQLLLRSGKEGRVRMKTAVFLDAWKASGNWAMVLSEAAKIPATATAERWIAASEGFSRIGKPVLAEAAADAALKHWPDRPLLSTVALGNARYARMDWPGAQTAYVKALTYDERNPVVHNNLALVLLERRCADLAEREAGKAIANETNPKLRAAFGETSAKIKRYTGTAIFCPALDGDAQAPVDYQVMPLNPETPRSTRSRPKRP